VNQWEETKQKERSKKNLGGVLEGIAKNLPSLQRSQKIQKRVASVGFDWPDTEGVFKKIKEELRELEEAVESEKKESIQEEIGDLYMIITNLSEKLGVDSEEALRKSNVKFEKRFNYIEKKLAKDNIKVSEMDLDELNTLWDDSKKLR
jgi:ATP diphosphatase